MLFSHEMASLWQIDKGMMDELKDVKKVLNPTEVLLVVDAMTGQEAAGTQLTCACISFLISLYFFFLKEC